MGITEQALSQAKELGIRPDRLEVLDQYFKRIEREDKRQAMIFKAVKDGVPVFEGTYGYNTKEYGLHMDTMFCVNSITKPFISALMLCLQEDGMVDISEPVYKYLPEFYGGGKEKICLWHLFTHSSGLEDSEIGDFIHQYGKEELGIPAPSEGAAEDDWDAYEKKMEEAVFGQLSNEKVQRKHNDAEYQIFLKMELKHKPREFMTYCNFGFCVLKYVIDEIIGEPIDQYAQRRLFHPIGMMDTYFQAPPEKWHRIAGYCEKAMAPDYFNSEYAYLCERGSGAIKTTVNDILKFGEMILNRGRANGFYVLSEASIDQMFVNYNKGVPCNGEEEYSRWSIGWNLHGTKVDDAGMLRPELTIEHGGFGGTKFWVDPVNHMTMALFSIQYEEPEKDYYLLFSPVSNIMYSALETSKRRI